MVIELLGLMCLCVLKVQKMQNLQTVQSLQKISEDDFCFNKISIKLEAYEAKRFRDTSNDDLEFRMEW